MAPSVRIRDQSRCCLHAAAVIGIREATERNQDGRFTGSMRRDPVRGLGSVKNKILLFVYELLELFYRAI